MNTSTSIPQSLWNTQIFSTTPSPIKNNYNNNKKQKQTKLYINCGAKTCDSGL